MKKVCYALLVIFALGILLTACGVNEQTEKENKEPMYVNITAEEAKEIMDSEAGYVIVDVREQDEYDAGHVPGAVLLPLGEIAEKAGEVLPDKNQMLLVYCRSGRRSKMAAEQLQALGYTDIREFGGILDWPYAVEK